MSYHGLGQTTPALVAETLPPDQAGAQYLQGVRMVQLAVGGAVVLGTLAIATGSFAWVRKRRAPSVSVAPVARTRGRRRRRR